MDKTSFRKTSVKFAAVPAPRGVGPASRWLKAVLELYRAVEHQLSRLGVLVVSAEVALPQELEALPGLGLSQGLLHLAASEDLQGVGVQVVQEVALLGFATVNRLSYSRTSASRASAALTQWMVAPFTFRPSAGLPPELSGS